MRCVLLRMLRRVDSVCSVMLEAFEVSEVPEVMRGVLLCMLEAVEGGLCLLEAMEVLQVMRCVLLCTLDAAEGRLCLLGGAGGCGGDAFCSQCTGGCGERSPIAGGAEGDPVCYSVYLRL